MLAIEGGDQGHLLRVALAGQPKKFDRGQESLTRNAKSKILRPSPGGAGMKPGLSSTHLSQNRRRIRTF